MENEIKFKLKDEKKIDDLLVGLGAEKYDEIKEVDYCFDTVDGLLSRQGKMLRLRKESKKSVLTLKGPILSARFKKREEISVNLEDFETARHLLGNMGFTGVFSKEKLRRGFRYKDLELFIDKLPFLGYYLEIEGKDSDILKAIKWLGLDPKDAIKESYNQLFKLFCVINQDKIKRFKKEMEFSFKCEREFRQCLKSRN